MERDHTDSISSDARLRTFGVFQIGGSQSNTPAKLSEFICKELARRWCGDELEDAVQQTPAAIDLRGADPSSLTGSAENPVNDMHRWAAEQANELSLELDRMAKTVRAIMESQLGSDVDTFYAKLRGNCLRQPDANEARTGANSQASQLLASIHGILGKHDHSGDSNKPAAIPLQTAAESKITQLADATSTAVRQRILGLVDSPSSRVRAACQAAEWFSVHLRSVEAQSKNLLVHTRQRRKQIAGALTDLIGAARIVMRWRSEAGRKTEEDADIDPLQEYFRLGVQENTILGVIKLTQQVANTVWTMIDQLRELTRHLNHLAQQFDPTDSSDERLAVKDSAANSVTDFHSWVDNALRLRVPSVIDELEKKFDTQTLREQGGLSTLFAKSGDQCQYLTDTMRAEARFALNDILKQINVVEALLNSQTDPQEINQRIRSWLEAATPRLLVCGGAKRLLLVLPQGSAAELLQSTIFQETEEMSTVLFHSDCDLVVCYEAEQLSFAHVAANLTGNRSDYAKIASRLHTRVDVSWTPLADV